MFHCKFEGGFPASVPVLCRSSGDDHDVHSIETLSHRKLASSISIIPSAKEPMKIYQNGFLMDATKSQRTRTSATSPRINLKVNLCVDYDVPSSFFDCN